MIKRISHAALIVEDLARALRFYCEVLGFKKLFSMTGEVEGHAFSTTYLRISAEQYLELSGGGTVKTEFAMQNIGVNHLCLEVDDLDEAARVMEKNNIPFMVKPCVGLDHNRLFWIEDPDGNKIEFMQIMTDSLQRCSEEAIVSTESSN